MVRFQVGFVARDDVTALTGFGVDQIDLEGIELFNDEMRVRHPAPVLGAANEAGIGKSGNE